MAFWNQPEPGEESGSGTAPPTEPPRFPKTTMYSQGVLKLSFTFAMASTAIVLYGILRGIHELTSKFNFFNFLKQLPIEALVIPFRPKMTFFMFFGLVGGFLIAMLYNVLVAQRLKLFGLQSNLD